jgi:hypothetical protein
VERAVERAVLTPESRDLVGIVDQYSVRVVASRRAQVVYVSIFPKERMAAGGANKAAIRVVEGT